MGLNFNMIRVFVLSLCLFLTGCITAAETGVLRRQEIPKVENKRLTTLENLRPPARIVTVAVMIFLI